MNQTGKPDIEHYVEHPGTVKISGKTPPKAAALCAFNNVKNGIETIDFFFIGGNAGLQATKAMVVLAHLILDDSNFSLGVTFFPSMYLTKTVDPVTKEEKDKTATVWRMVMFRTDKNLPVKFTRHYTLELGNHENTSGRDNLSNSD